MQPQEADRAKRAPWKATKASRGATKASRGATKASHGATKASLGATKASHGATKASHGATKASRGATKASRGATRSVSGHTHALGCDLGQRAFISVQGGPAQWPPLAVGGPVARKVYAAWARDGHCSSLHGWGFVVCMGMSEGTRRGWQA